MGSRRPVIIAIACTVVGSILAGLAVWFFYGRPQVLGTTDTESAIATTKGASTAKRARGRSDVIATFAGKPNSRAE